jgi:hypothetical protein
MGDAPRPGEVHRITIEMTGPIDQKKFDAYKKELRDVLARCAGTKTRIRRIGIEKTDQE